MNTPTRPKIYVGLPLYSMFGAHVGSLAAVLHHATRSGRFDVWGKIETRSLLAHCFNVLYVEALNDKDTSHYAQVHGDVVPCAGWLDVLHAEMVRLDADVISAVISMKNLSGTTSTAIGVPGIMWGARRRLTHTEVHQKLPETFSIEDVVMAGLAEPGDQLLINSGCMLINLRKPWIRETGPQRPGMPGKPLRAFFTIADAIFEMADGTYQARVASEDWNYGRMGASAGARVFATRKVAPAHWGHWAFQSNEAWGELETDDCRDIGIDLGLKPTPDDH